MPSVIIAESALELIPKSLHSHSSVMAYSKRMSKGPDKCLLDISWHYSAMKSLDDSFRRGRPDLIHMCLHTVCSTPLFLNSDIQLYIHTRDNHVITIHPQVRLPKSYHRFIGLFEQLYEYGTINDNTTPLLDINHMTLHELINKLEPTQVFGFTTQGKQMTIKDASLLVGKNDCIVVGGFQKGHFENTQDMSSLLQIHKESLDAHIVLGRILYEYEIHL